VIRGILGWKADFVYQQCQAKLSLQPSK